MGTSFFLDTTKGGAYLYRLFCHCQQYLSLLSIGGTHSDAFARQPIRPWLQGRAALAPRSGCPGGRVRASSRRRRLRWRRGGVRGGRRREEGLARRVLDAAGGVRGDHPCLPGDGGRIRGRVRAVVCVVRRGNPENIQTWDDLLREGVEVITPNPFTSGGAKWNIMAAYGAQLEQGKSEEEAIEYLRELFVEHVPVQDKSARESLQTFSAGKGDVLLAYENEAIFAQQAGQPLEYVVPDETILIENPVAVVSSSGNKAAAQAFVDYLRSPDAQRIFGEKGYRPVVEDVFAEFDYPEPDGLFPIDDVGGWDEVNTRFFDREESIFADIENELGVPTDG